MEYEISCGFVLINSTSKKILVLKLSDEFEWDLPKGHHEEGETYLEAAFREVKEEVGISESEILTFKDDNGVPVGEFFDYISPVSGNTRRIYLFIGETDADICLSPEHCGFVWCTSAEGLKYLKYKNVQDCIKELFEKISFSN